MKYINYFISVICVVFILHNNASAQCSAPTDLSISAIGSFGAKASWTATAGAEYYLINVKTTSGTIRVLKFSTTQTNILINGFSPNINYSCTIASICAGGQSVESKAVLFTTAELVFDCSPPSNINSVKITASNAELRWDVEKKAQRYFISMTDNKTNKQSQYIANNTPFYLNNLNASSKYTFYITSECQSVRGKSSADVVFTTPPITCETPSIKGVSEIFFNKARIDYSLVDSASNYKFEIRRSQDSIYAASTTTFPYIYSKGLKPNTTYFYRVSAVCAGTQSKPSSAASFTTLNVGPCDAPIQTSVQANPTVAFVNWTYVIGAKSYSLTLREEGNANSSTFTTAETYFTFKGLKSNTKYSYDIAAICNNIPSSLKITNTFTTQKAPPCIAPKDISINVLGTALTQLLWAYNPVATKYLVNVKSADTVFNVSTFNNAYSFTKLKRNTTYHFSVSATCDATSSSMSDVFSATTPSTSTCATPQNVTVTDVGVEKATLLWSPTQSNYRYEYSLQKAGKKGSIEGTSGTSWLLTRLQPDTIYEYAVRTNCIYDDTISPFSALQTFKTQKSGVCKPASQFKVSNISTNQAEITWEGEPSTTSWFVFYNLGTNNYSPTYEKKHIASSLQPNTTYTIHVNGNCYGNVNSTDETVTFNTLPLTRCQDDIKDANNSFSSASVLPIGTNISSKIEALDEVDYYRFSTTSKEPNMKISLINLGKDNDLKVYNAAGKRVAYSYNIKTQDEIIKLNGLPAGDYYAVVNNFYDGSLIEACYTLKAEISAIPYGIIPLHKADFRKSDDKTADYINYKVFPNPIQQDASLEIDTNIENATLDVSIVDVLGRLKKSFTFDISPNQNLFNLELNDLENGLYLVILKDKNKQKTLKIVVNK